MSNDHRNKEQDTNLELSAAQQDPGRASPHDFTITPSLTALGSQDDASMVSEGMRQHPNRPRPERNTVPAVDWRKLS